MLEETGRFPVGVEAIAVFDILADWNGELMLMALASVRPGPGIMSIWTSLSQQPAPTAGPPAFALQQNAFVNEPSTRGHRMMLLKLSIESTILSRFAHELLGKHGLGTRYRMCNWDSIRRHPN